MIRLANATDAPAIADIYNHYVRETVATFEETPVSGEEAALRISHVLEANRPWLVAQSGHGIIGYAYSTAWKARSAYRYAAEISIYLDPDHQGAGWGTQLYGELFVRLKRAGTHSVMAGITLPNDASVALHEKFGMRKVAHFPEVGYKFDQWLDVAYWHTKLTD